MPTRIWLPDGMTEEEVDLVTNIEYVKFRLRLNKTKGTQMKAEIGAIRAFIRQTRGAVSNLRLLRIKIVSLREYRKIQLELDKAESMLRGKEKGLIEHEETREALKAQVSKMEAELTKLRERGKVLEMSEYGKRKKQR